MLNNKWHAYWSRVTGLWRRKRPQRLQPGMFYDDRSRVVFWLLSAGFAIIAARAFVIHLFPSSEENLREIAQRQYQDKIQLAPYRGLIYDRRKEPLAMSIRLPSLFVNPRLFGPERAEVKTLAHLLGMPEREIQSIAGKRSYFAWLKRKVPPDVAQKVLAMNLDGLNQVMEPSRYYPMGTGAANLLGYVGLDNHGLMGLERSLNDYLRGETHTVTQSRDARGRTIFLHSDQAAPEKAGHNITLTIDRAIQDISERALVEGAEKAKAKAGFVIVSDPHTGRILALANYPIFDPNNLKKLRLENTRNHALSDLFEPGSVVKPVVISEALNENKTRPDETHDCENGVYAEDTFRIRDDHKGKLMTTREVIMNSSNICTYKIAKRMGPRALFETYRKYGFGSHDNLLDFPGQSLGRMAEWSTWRPSRFANIAFGQGLAVTGMELVSAYNAIANGGKLMRPYIIDRIENSEGQVVVSNTAKVLRQVMSTETSRTMREILRDTVLDGTGKAAQLADYSSAGKTGTTQKVDPKLKAYSKDMRIASFIGFAPALDPNIVIYVVIDEPGVRPYYGATWAAPIFKKIAETSLRYLNVAPDLPPPEAKGGSVAKKTGTTPARL